MLPHMRPVTTTTAATGLRTTDLRTRLSSVVLNRGRVSQRLSHVARTASPDAPANPTTHFSDGVSEVRLAWFERPCKGFGNVSTVDEIDAALAKTHGKHVALEIYAGWCASCKAAYPALCKIPQDAKLAGSFTFLKANAEDESVFAWVKAHQITGLPHILFFSPQGKLLGSMSSSFKKISAVKAAMHTILDNPAATRFGLDPQGAFVPRD